MAALNSSAEIQPLAFESFEMPKNPLSFGLSAASTRGRAVFGWASVPGLRRNGASAKQARAGAFVTQFLPR